MSGIPEPVCESCGHPASNHNFRHPFRAPSLTLNTNYPPKTIVAEISTHYRNGEPPGKSLSSLFEKVIQTNRARGYRLRDWKLTSVGLKDTIYETIVAVFETNEV